VPRARFHLDHLFARRRLSAYVDGDLEPDERERVVRHLAECEECGRVERSLRRLLGGLALLGGRRPARLADEAIERVREADRPADGPVRR
jgi:anti-sigma factor RsiW